MFLAVGCLLLAGWDGEIGGRSAGLNAERERMVDGDPDRQGI